MAKSIGTQIKELIEYNGKITFAEFMNLVLFSSPYGYYYSGQNIGQRDYFTSPTAHPLFGALIAVQLKQIWEIMDKPKPFYVIEFGAGDGILGKDIVKYSKSLGEKFADYISYVSLDYQPSVIPFSGIDFVKSSGIPFRDVEGCFISNELFDSFPVHRFVKDSGKLKEIFVGLEANNLVEIIDEPSTPMLEMALRELELPEGFRGEVNLAVDGWLDALSNTLLRGIVLTIDYGYLAQDLYSEERSRGTLRCYYKHTIGSNPYDLLGLQDITSHVDFTSLIRSGVRKGFSSLGFTTQREFLNNLGFQKYFEALRGIEMRQSERYRNQFGMLELVKEGHMGDFKVLIQSKGIPKDTSLLGFDESGETPKRLIENTSNLDIPLIAEDHLSVISGRYPYLEVDFEELWPFKDRS